MSGTRKILVVSFEALLLLVSFFALCYFLDLGEEFALASASSGDKSENMTFEDWVSEIEGTELIESSEWINYPISSAAEGAGCCFFSANGQICGTAIPENCAVDSPFAEGALCSETSFCRKGCCFDAGSGVYDKNVLEVECPSEWTADPNCNMPEANLGCCVLGKQVIFETLRQCEIDSLERGFSEEVDWRGDVNEGECFLLAAGEEKGACVLGKTCKFVNEADCVSYGGNFAKGYLCTSSSLDTECEMTEQTTCVEGSDKVYFLDSCGNVANVYDSTKAHDAAYWEMVIGDEGLCDAEGDDASCGNCDRFAGSICAASEEDNFDVDIGGFYCKDVSCEFKGERYENGESWCVYDGAIGDGDDVVGSRHWKYVCSQGKVLIEPCADYRNQICVQTKTLDVGEEEVEFSNAACIANNWRECIDLNGEEEAMDRCERTLNCRVDTVNVADKFKFDVCLPRYPGGFSLTDERYTQTAESLCSMGSQTCTVVQEQKTWGGCRYIANEDCLSEKFAQEMNDFCTGLGDCGGAANILGEYSENYAVKKDGDVRRSMFLSQGWINTLKALANPIPGQFAEVENYEEYLEAAGFWGVHPDVSVDEDGGAMDSLNNIAMGLGGIGMILSYLGGGGAAATGTAAGTAATTSTASLSAFSGVAIGAGIGMVAGAMLAKSMGVSPGGSILMAAGGALIGGVLGYAYLMGGLTALGPVGWAIIIVGVVLMVLGALFSGSECPAIEVSFECRAWQPVSGGKDCEECNGDPLKPCSQYRCESLGSSCELINVGSEDELCVDASPGDTVVPIVSMQGGFDGAKYTEKENGFEVTNLEGGCLEAYLPLKIGVVTSEPAQCKFDVLAKDDFKDMNFLFGGNSYLYNHTSVFSLPDPSHGQSQGANWSGELDLFVKCRDKSGLLSPGLFKIEMCVVEADDKTAPLIVKTTPESGELVGFDSMEQNVEVITNELASCRWSLSDVGYGDMENDFVCDDEFGAQSDPYGYVCMGNAPISGSDNAYYVRCMDQPWLNGAEGRNANEQSVVLALKRPDSKISIEGVSPSGDIEIGSDLATIDLSVVTAGGGDSHFCSYSFSGYDKMIEFFETGQSREHKRVLNRNAGRQKIYVECRDETGDFVRNTTEFNIIQDRSEPMVSRIWQDKGFVNLVLSEVGKCRFSFDSCRFAWDDGYDIGSGTELRFAVVRGEKYYIKCKDDFGNMPSACSVEIVAG